MGPRRIDDLLRSGSNDDLSGKRAHAPGDDRGLDDVLVERVQQEGGDHATVGTDAPHVLVSGVSRGELSHWPDRTSPRMPLFQLIVEHTDLRADQIADAALKARILVGELRSTIRTECQGVKLPRGAERDAPSALSTDATLVDLGNKIAERLDRFSHCPFFPLLSFGVPETWRVPPQMLLSPVRAALFES